MTSNQLVGNSIQSGFTIAEHEGTSWIQTNVLSQPIYLPIEYCRSNDNIANKAKKLKFRLDWKKEQKWPKRQRELKD